MVSTMGKKKKAGNRISECRDRVGNRVGEEG